MQHLPLEGIRVFEFGTSIAGPFAAWILAELGADVIKVERPEGDDARTWGPPFWNGASTLFHAINRNKDAIRVDLKDAAAVADLRARIVETADVVIQNMRPGVLDSAGLCADDLIAENPRLIYCNVRAYGASGPMKDRPGYDALMQAFGGLMSVTGEEGRPPVRAGVSLMDKGTGMWCVIGILAALRGRDQTGRGGVIDTSLFETSLTWMSMHAADYQVTHKRPAPMGTGIRGIVPYQAYRCSDDFLIVAGSNDRLFVKLANLVGHPEWAADPRFRTNPDRSAHRDELNALLEPILAQAPRAVWQERLDAVGIPNAPIQSIDEVLAHPQLDAIGIAQETGDPAMRLLGLPVSFDGERPPFRHLCRTIEETPAESRQP